MASIDNLPIETGNYVNSEENVENLVDILRDGDQSSALFPDKHNTLNTQPAKSGNMVGSDGNVYNIIDLVKNSGGISIDQIIVKSAIIPAASKDYVGAVYQYAGATTETYTHGYIYECIKSSAIYTGTVSFEPASISSTVVSCDGDDFANFVATEGTNPEDVVSGTMTYDIASSLWIFSGLDSEGTEVSHIQEYQQDYEDAGFTFTGTPADGDVVTFTCTIEEVSAQYSWQRIDVQPNVISPSGVPEVQTPDGSNPDAIVNVDYVDSVVGTIETALETV